MEEIMESIKKRNILRERKKKIDKIMDKIKRE
jgi:hypothetical protein